MTQNPEPAFIASSWTVSVEGGDVVSGELWSHSTGVEFRVLENGDPIGSRIHATLEEAQADASATLARVQAPARSHMTVLRTKGLKFEPIDDDPLPPQRATPVVDEVEVGSATGVDVVTAAQNLLDKLRANGVGESDLSPVKTFLRIKGGGKPTEF